MPRGLLTSIVAGRYATPAQAVRMSAGSRRGPARGTARYGPGAAGMSRAGVSQGCEAGKSPGRERFRGLRAGRGRGAQAGSAGAGRGAQAGSAGAGRGAQAGSAGPGPGAGQAGG
jgi:hypothetical protein